MVIEKGGEIGNHGFSGAVVDPKSLVELFPGDHIAFPGDVPDSYFAPRKAAVRVVDKTVNPPTATITPDPDPKMNNWNLGPGSDPVPTGLTDLGFGAEARFVVSLTSSDSPWHRNNRLSVVCSTPVTSHSSSRTRTRAPGASTASVAIHGSPSHQHRPLNVLTNLSR